MTRLSKWWLRFRAKITHEPARRSALIAAISAIALAGSLTQTVSQVPNGSGIQQVGAFNIGNFLPNTTATGVQVQALIDRAAVLGYTAVIWPAIAVTAVDPIYVTAPNMELHCLPGSSLTTTVQGNPGIVLCNATGTGITSGLGVNGLTIIGNFVRVPMSTSFFGNPIRNSGGAIVSINTNDDKIYNNKIINFDTCIFSAGSYTGGSGLHGSGTGGITGYTFRHSIYNNEFHQCDFGLQALQYSVMLDQNNNAYNITFAQWNGTSGPPPHGRYHDIYNNVFTCTGSIVGNVLTVTTPGSGTNLIQPLVQVAGTLPISCGSYIAGIGIPKDIQILQQTSGVTGQTGGYLLNTSISSTGSITITIVNPFNSFTRSLFNHTEDDPFSSGHKFQSCVGAVVIGLTSNGCATHCFASDVPSSEFSNHVGRNIIGQTGFGNSECAGIVFFGSDNSKCVNSYFECSPTAVNYHGTRSRDSNLYQTTTKYAGSNVSFTNVTSVNNNPFQTAGWAGDTETTQTLFNEGYANDNGTPVAPTTTISSGTYNSSTGLVTLTIGSDIAAGSSIGGLVTLAGVTGTGVDLSSVNGLHTIVAGTTGTTLEFVIAASLTITSIAGGSVTAGGNQGAYVFANGSGHVLNLPRIKGTAAALLATGSSTDGAAYFLSSLCYSGAPVVHGTTSVVFLDNVGTLNTAANTQIQPGWTPANGNGFNFVGVPAGSAPEMQTQGSDTDIGVIWRLKGAPGLAVRILDISGDVIRWSNVANHTNYPNIFNAITGGIVRYSSSGTVDSDVYTSFDAKGAGPAVLGLSTNKVSFYGGAGALYRTGAIQAAIITTAATNIAPYGFATQAQADNVVALLNEVRATLVGVNLFKGAA